MTVKFIPPCLATLHKSVPRGEAWIHEIKFDGYRIQAHRFGGKATLYTRSGLDWTSDFQTIAEQLKKLKAKSFVIDGEAVVQDEKGRPSFGALQAALGEDGRSEDIVYYAFDLLILDGADLRSQPLLERKRLLARLLGKASKKSRIQYSGHVEADDGRSLFDQACKGGLEGIVSKKAAAPYRSGRGADWLKVKCTQRGTFVVIGYVKGGAGGSFGAMRLAKKERGKLHYIGKVGTGWNNAMAIKLAKMLAPIEIPKAPVEGRLIKKDTRWVEPRYEADIVYTEISNDGMLRHPSFKGIEPIKL